MNLRRFLPYIAPSLLAFLLAACGALPPVMIGGGIPAPKRAGIALSAFTGGPCAIDDTQPQPGSGATPAPSAPIRQNFFCTIQDLAALSSENLGPSAPSQPLAGTRWVNNAASPWVEYIYTGASWIETATIDPVGLTYAPRLTNAQITAALGFTPANVADNLSDLANPATARSNLGVTATGADTTYAYRSNNLSDLANPATALANLSGLPSVGSLAALAASSTSIFPTVVVRATYGNGNGAPPLLYQTSASACTLNGGAGDNGAQVRSSDGKCFNAIFPNGPLDVRQWGANADATRTGGTDNTGAFNAAESYAATVGRNVYVPAVGAFGVGSAPVTEYTNVLIVGDAPGAITATGTVTGSVVIGLSGTSAVMFQSQNFASLTGTNTAGGPFKFGFRNITIDGNRAARTGSNPCVQWYGYEQIIDHVDVYNCPGDNFYSEWATGAGVPVSKQVGISSVTYNSSSGLVTLTTGSASGLAPGNLFMISGATGTGSYASINGAFLAGAGTSGTTVTFTIATGLTLTITGGTLNVAGDSMEAHVNHFVSEYSGGNGLTWYGPHDSILRDVVTCCNIGYGLQIANSSSYVGNSAFIGFHSYGNQLSGVHCDGAQMLITHFQSENNRNSGDGITAVNACSILGSFVNIYSNAGAGISLAGTSGLLISGGVLNSNAVGLLDNSSTSSSLANVVANRNTGLGFDIEAGGILASNLQAISNGGGGAKLNGPGQQIVTGLWAYGNTGNGIEIDRNETSITGVYSAANTNTGILLSGALGDITVEGRSEGNSTQINLGTNLAANSHVNVVTYAAGGQTSYAGTFVPGAAVNIQTGGTSPLPPIINGLYGPDGLIGFADGINCNATGDTTINLLVPSFRWGINTILIKATTGSGSSYTTARVGVYSAAAQGGAALAAQQAISGITATAYSGTAQNTIPLTLAAPNNGYNFTTLYLNVGTAQGGTCLIDAYVYARPLP